MVYFVDSPCYKMQFLIIAIMVITMTMQSTTMTMNWEQNRMPLSNHLRL